MHTPLLRFPLTAKLRPAGRPLGWLAGVLLAGLAATPAQAQSQTVYGLNRISNSLIKTTITALGSLTTPTVQPVIGLSAGQTLVGLDSRPATGELFGLAYNGNGTAQVYRIDKTTAMATAVGAPIALALGTGIEGIGFDFNPTVDRIRVTSALNDASFRLNPNNGLQVDSKPNEAGLQADGDLKFLNDSPFAGQSPNVGSVAYTNSFIGATATTLYDIDESRSQLFTQSPPNDGVLIAPLAVTSAGANLLAAGDQTDFDIYTDPGTRIQLTLLTRTRGSFPAVSTTFYQLNLGTGVATEVTGATLPQGVSVDDIAIGIDRAAPAASGQLTYAVTTTNNLISFNSGQPGFLLSATPITGILADQTLVGTDFRPNTGQLMGLGYNQTNGQSTLYIIDQATAVATPVNATPIVLALGTDAAALSTIGFDFNPTVDRIRVVSANNANYRLNPNNGLQVDGKPDEDGLQADGDLKYGDGAPADPAVGTGAYTNSFAGSTATGLYVLDHVDGSISLQNPPNEGVLVNTRALTGVNASAGGSIGALNDLDVYFDGTANTPYLSAVPAGETNSRLYTLNAFSPTATTDQVATEVGTIGLGLTVRDIAVQLAASSVPNASAGISNGGRLLYGIAGGNLVSFDSNNPGQIRTAVNITGLPASQVLAGADFRPATGELFALGYAATTEQGQLYKLNTTTGALTAVGPLQNLGLGSVATATPGVVTAPAIAFDFNPTVDLIRIVSAANRVNLRVSPIDAAVTVDTPVTNNGGGTPVISGAAYTNNDNNANTGTFLYGYDQSTNQLVRATLTATPASTNAANNGTYANIGSSGLSVNPGVDFDIFSDLADAGAPMNTGFLAASVGAGNTFDNLYTINLANGSVGEGQRIGNGTNLTGLAAFLVPGPVINLTVFTWTGATDREWNKGSNWSTGTVPTAANDVIIPNTANDPVVSSAQPVRAVTLGSGATLTAANGGTLTVNGNFVNNGGTTLGEGSGTIAFAGPTTQVVSGTLTYFNNLSAGPAGITAQAPVQVQRLLTLNGNLVSNGNLTLLSNEAGTALVVNNGGTVSGAVAVQRSISAADNTFTGVSYRHYAAPVSGSTVSDLTTAEFTPVVNPEYNTAGNTITPFPTVYSYEQSRVTTSGNPVPQDFDKGFQSPNTLGDALEVGRGYTVNISAAAVVDFVGTLNNGDYTRGGLVRSLPAAADPSNASGWHLLGNPYPSPIDADLLTLTNMDAAVYVSRATGPYAGTYRAYVAGSNLNNGDDQLAVGQGFFMRTAASGATGSVGFTNAARLTTYASPLFQRGASAAPLVRLDLRNDKGQADDLTVYFEEQATAGFDSQYDAYKLQGGGPVLLAAEVGATTLLSIDALPAFTGTDATVKLRLQARAGTYTLRAAELLRLPAGMNVLLRDAQTGTVTDLTKQGSYTFQLAGSAAGRFTLLFSTQGALASAPAALSQQVSLFPNPARNVVSISLPAALSRQATNVQLVNALGQTVRRTTLDAGTRTLSLTGVAQGVYTLRLDTAQGTVTKRLVVE